VRDARKLLTRRVWRGLSRPVRSPVAAQLRAPPLGIIRTPRVFPVSQIVRPYIWSILSSSCGVCVLCRPVRSHPRRRSFSNFIAAPPMNRRRTRCRPRRPKSPRWAKIKPPMTARPSGAFVFTASAPHSEGLAHSDDHCERRHQHGPKRVKPASWAGCRGASRPGSPVHAAKLRPECLFALATPSHEWPRSARHAQRRTRHQHSTRCRPPAAGSACIVIKASVKDWKLMTMSSHQHDSRLLSHVQSRCRCRHGLHLAGR